VIEAPWVSRLLAATGGWGARCLNHRHLGAGELPARLPLRRRVQPLLRSLSLLLQPPSAALLLRVPRRVRRGLPRAFPSSMFLDKNRNDIGKSQSKWTAFHRQFRDKNRRDIGECQPKWTASTMETPAHQLRRQLLAPLLGAGPGPLDLQRLLLQREPQRR
jgi:hypothetical protein